MKIFSRKKQQQDRVEPPLHCRVLDSKEELRYAKTTKKERDEFLKQHINRYGVSNSEVSPYRSSRARSK